MKFFSYINIFTQVVLGISQSLKSCLKYSFLILKNMFKKIVFFFKNQYFFYTIFTFEKYLFQSSEVAFHVYIYIQKVSYVFEYILKKCFKREEISTFLQKSVLFFILFLHLKIFISIIRSCIDVYITFGKFHTYLNTYEDSIFKHSNI